MFLQHTPCQTGDVDRLLLEAAFIQENDSSLSNTKRFAPDGMLLLRADHAAPGAMDRLDGLLQLNDMCRIDSTVFDPMDYMTR